jgi:hypothetical protein
LLLLSKRKFIIVLFSASFVLVEKNVWFFDFDYLLCVIIKIDRLANILIMSHDKRWQSRRVRHDLLFLHFFAHYLTFCTQILSYVLILFVKYTLFSDSNEPMMLHHLRTKNYRIIINLIRFKILLIHFRFYWNRFKFDQCTTTHQYLTESFISCLIDYFVLFTRQKCFNSINAT